jgi:hypothetical protein
VPSLTRHNPLFTIDTPQPPPDWALLERLLIDAQSEACIEFFDKYFDDRGYLECIPRWGGDDGPDDAIENLLNWTTLHALGGPDEILDLFRKGFEGHVRQYTEARTTEVELGRDGMYYREFPTCFDWFHHGEGLSSYFLYGLSDPYDPLYEQRMRRWTSMYDGSDESCPNYDPEHRVIRSMFNGSRGPLLRKATGLDWAGDYIDVADLHLAHGERSHDEMIAHFAEYNDVVGDNPLNLEATHLGFVAYALTGEDRYRNWVVDYVDAWLERTEQNGGIIPSNVGLDGTIGGECDGKWYGGVYGWGFTVTVPQTGAKANRPAAYSRPCYGFAHAMQLTGDRSYGEAWGKVLDAVSANSKVENGQTVYPRMYGDDGWYDFGPKPMNRGAQEVWFWSMRDADRARVPDDPWVQYLTGTNDDYPKTALEKEFTRLRDKIERMRNDGSTKDTRLSDVSLPMNPALTDQLTQLMMGGLPTGRRCHTLHCRLRYFDPDRRRAGLPADVGALVERMSDDSVTVSLVNLSPVNERTVVIQGGGYAEHTMERVTVEGGATVDVDTSYGADRTAFALCLAPSAGCRLQIQQKRFAHRPTLAFPWDRR